MDNEQLKQYALRRFAVDESNQADMDTLHLRGVSGCFKPECEQELKQCQQAIEAGATIKLAIRK